MTEKRFNFVGGYLYDGNKPIGHVEDVKFRQDFEDIVNALHEENVKLQARNKYLATKIQRERNIHVKEHKKWEEEIQKENKQLKEDNMLLIEDSEKYRKLSIQFDNRNKELISENEQLKKALVELKEIGDYQEGRIKELNDENEHLESELEKVVEVCRKYGIYKEELQHVLADYDKMLNENGERAIRYKYCVNSR